MEQILTLSELAVDVAKIMPNTTQKGVKDKFLELWLRGEREIFRELDTYASARAYETWLFEKYHLEELVTAGEEPGYVIYDQNRFSFIGRLHTFGCLPDDRDWKVTIREHAADHGLKSNVAMDHADSENSPSNRIRKLKDFDDLGAEIAQLLAQGKLSQERFQLLDRITITSTLALRFLLFASYKIPVKLKRFVIDTATIRAPRGRRSGSAVYKDACCRYLEKLIVNELYEPRAGGVPAAASMIKLIFDPPLTEVTIEANIRDAHAECI